LSRRWRCVAGRYFLPGGLHPLVTDRIFRNAALYVRPADLRIAARAQPGFEVEVLNVQRTGPLVRAQGRTRTNDQPVVVEILHLHHDAPLFVAGAELRLRAMQFSVYDGVAPAARTTAHDVVGVAATPRLSVGG
jgi:hypothetical protein